MACEQSERTSSVGARGERAGWTSTYSANEDEESSLRPGELGQLSPRRELAVTQGESGSEGTHPPCDAVADARVAERGKVRVLPRVADLRARTVSARSSTASTSVRARSGERGRTTSTDVTAAMMPNMADEGGAYSLTANHGIMSTTSAAPTPARLPLPRPEPMYQTTARTKDRQQELVVRPRGRGGRGRRDARMPYTSPATVPAQRCSVDRI